MCYAVQFMKWNLFIVLRCIIVYGLITWLLVHLECTPVLYYAVQMYSKPVLPVHCWVYTFVLWVPCLEVRTGFLIGQSVGGVLAPVLPHPGVATLRCCHLAILCSPSVGLVCAPLTARDHWSEEEVEKGWGGELCGLLCCFGSTRHVTNSGVTGGAGGEGVVTLF